MAKKKQTTREMVEEMGGFAVNIPVATRHEGGIHHKRLGLSELYTLARVEHIDCPFWIVTPEGYIVGECKDLVEHESADGKPLPYVFAFCRAFPDSSESCDIERSMIVPKVRDKQGYLEAQP